MKHTPGPWASNSADSFELGVYGNGYRIAKMTGGEINRDIANARLIAAAPDLLAIAEGVLGMLQNCSVTSGVCCCGEEIDRHSRAMDCGHTPVDSGAYYAKALFEDVTAAIAKATGE